ncbi:N5-(carboxyethyl)ornithine synthase [Ancylomarina subtilis]|uniref:N5-(Carboxyethyl)ornithine synthase n=1 Tax=Ancylomarina subtilis TaxID=1639035 RepID=A0A4Q7VKD7_9BACT|nr:N(5)-(carboxyethyl)ornithine synthase [Ancylomarina subtilis]RZT96488.1 N5-(carboxyethyl)ornithine synthase [Ancylomarina subtilis]
MKTIGFPISVKENENRRALLPIHLSGVKYKNQIYIESGYGDVMGYTDDDYSSLGINVVSREEVLSKNIICDPKIGDAEYLKDLSCQTIFGWVHAVQNKEITDALVKNKLSAYAWEDMFEDGRHTFYKNNEIAGEAAIMHAYTLHGLFPYNTKVAVIGRGNIARGALKILTVLGADVTVYDRRTESLLRKEMSEYDVIVNGILWDTNRTDHIIYKSDLSIMKAGALIIDISCDAAGAIETSVPTTIENPIYVVEGVTHYAVDHTPSLFYKTISFYLSEIVSGYIDDIITDKPNEVLGNALIIEGGQIVDERINIFQNR